MRQSLSFVLFLLIYSFAKGQALGVKWYSETENNGVIIQNSYPKGGPYRGITNKHFNYSYLVFYTHVVNETEKSLELNLSFSADSFPIPNSPNTFMKLFLPPDIMTFDKRNLFSYGLPELKSFDQPTAIQKKLKPKEDCLFYVVAIFYQTRAEAGNQERGGNRAELILKGKDLFYNMPPQVNFQHVGRIVFGK